MPWEEYEVETDFGTETRRRFCDSREFIYQDARKEEYIVETDWGTERRERTVDSRGFILDNK